MIYNKYLIEKAKETFDYVVNGKIKTTKFPAERVSNQTIRSKTDIGKDGYIEDNYGHRYTNPTLQDGWYYYGSY